MSNPVRIWDPFGGTGTVWFEATKIENCVAESTDLNPITPLLVQDNLFFFSAPIAVLRRGRRNLIRAIKLLRSSGHLLTKLNHLEKATLKDIQWTAHLYTKLAQGRAKGDDRIDPSVLQAMIKERDVFRRLFLYVALRTSVRHVNQFARRAADGNTAFVKEAETLVFQFNALIRQRERERKGTYRIGSLGVFQGSYSRSCGVAREWLLDFLRSSAVTTSVHVRDACIASPGSYDVIVTDPPYGFNTEEDERELAQLYALFPRAMVRSLRDGGQLVICLPDRSHTGRKLPAFTTPGFVTQQVLTEAELIGREAVVAAQVLPKPGGLFRPPFYWESERALRRAILHFRFRDKPRQRSP